jgi:hypothetical protein
MRVFSYRDNERGISVHIRTNDDLDGTASIEVIRPEGQPDGSVSDVSDGITQVPVSVLLRFAQDVEINR